MIEEMLILSIGLLAGFALGVYASLQRKKETRE